MTLARTALRLAAVGALAGTQGARPTIAQNRVYDTRIGRIDPKDFEDAKPLLILSTEEDAGDAVDLKDGRANTGGPPFWRTIDLTIELAFAARAEPGAPFDVGYAGIDAGLAIKIDLLEHQVWRALKRGTSPMANAFQRVAILHGYQSHPVRSDEHGDTVAGRVLTFRCRVKDDCPADSAATGLDALPSPLREVARAQAPGSYAARACAALAADLVAAAAATPPAPVPPLRRIGMAFDLALKGPGDGKPDIDAALTLSNANE